MMKRDSLAMSGRKVQFEASPTRHVLQLPSPPAEFHEILTEQDFPKPAVP